jgi:hypothetical protein
MYPFERSLVRKYQDKPFTIVGVNSDGKEKLAEIIADQTIKWPCFWDGGSPGGPIASKWNVSSWPTIYILDEKGVIRFNPEGDPREIDDDIYKLLEEMKAKPVDAKQAQ